MNRWPAQFIRYTRNWLHYGIPALVLISVLVGAVESLLSR